jgi:hypothetical protein
LILRGGPLLRCVKPDVFHVVLGSVCQPIGS